MQSGSLTELLFFLAEFPLTQPDSPTVQAGLWGKIIFAPKACGILAANKEVFMKLMPFAVTALLGGLILAGLTACDARAEDAMPAPTTDRSFVETVRDGYNELKHSVTSAFGGYTGDSSEDSKTYMKNYQHDLKTYHDSIRNARDDYRKARLDEQKAYLEHHRTLPMNEDIDADVNATSH